MGVLVGSSSKLEVDDGSSRLEVEVGCSRLLDSSITLEVKADSSSISEVEADIEADITSSRGRCCCITEDFLMSKLFRAESRYLGGSTLVGAGAESKLARPHHCYL